MDLLQPSTIKDLLEKHGAKPSKSLGQNFLIHKPTLTKIIENANLSKTDTVIEVGPGLGILTQELAKNRELALETPDLKFVDSSIAAVSTPSTLNTQTLGDIFGGSDHDRKNVTEYAVQPGDTVDSIAAEFDISANTILWANNLTKGSALKSGQTLIILPVSGISHVVKNGDTLSQISATYKASLEAIVEFNNLADAQGGNEIYIGDVLIIPNGTKPQIAAPAPVAVPIANNYFIAPAEGQITQGLHYYNAVDLANKCGTPVYAAAAGKVQRAIGGGLYNRGMGNYVTILHSNGAVTYYGHLMNVLVKPGAIVGVGERIGLMGSTGNSTGCHVHFQVIGAQNPLRGYGLGAFIKYKGN